MRDPKRIPIVINELEALWEMMPDLRLWQVISVMEDVAKSRMDPFYIEDDEWLTIIRQIRERKLHGGGNE